MSDAPKPKDSERRLADSPVPWVLAFGVAALVALFAIAPKHHARQERLERMAQTREGILYDKSGLTETSAQPSEPPAEKAPDALQPTERRVNSPATERLPSDDIEPPPVDQRPAKPEMPPVAVFIAVSLAAVAAGFGLLSYLRSVSRDRRPRSPENDP